MFPSMVGDAHIVPVLHICLATLAQLLSITQKCLANALWVWRLWWLGNQASGYPPFRSLHSSYFATSSRKIFSEWSVLVRHLTTAIETSTGTKMQRPKTQDEADSLYNLGMSNVLLKPSSHPHKQRMERAVTTLRRIRQALHDANPQPRSVLFHHRK
ncbi:hypothetical protein PHMEG_00016948 [Phytophthora megakarya]|uniref:Uncharacterized protein n=1 Tax=Phytophthora megakarya TaxID=4795 RepID=A0A225VYL6_9STRA|nr:hypothetical protein PHMEG_00016948 [Phytophthora megakarya]